MGIFQYEQYKQLDLHESSLSLSLFLTHTLPKYSISLLFVNSDVNLFLQRNLQLEYDS